jgi:hypothetical protein
VPVSTNTVGQMYALTVFTPIIPDRVDGLRTYLGSLPRRPSPLARLGATHFARWVIVADFVSDASQPEPDQLPTPYLLFSATLDGALGPFLDDLCAELAPEAEEIWGRCVGAPQPARGAALKAYLEHNQVQTGLFFAAYPDAGVDTVRNALSVRAKTIAFAVRSQGMDPPGLQQAFLQEFGP